MRTNRGPGDPALTAAGQVMVAARGLELSSIDDREPATNSGQEQSRRRWQRSEAPRSRSRDLTPALRVPWSLLDQESAKFTGTMVDRLANLDHPTPPRRRPAAALLRPEAAGRPWGAPTTRREKTQGSHVPGELDRAPER
jgi:hypothetical protein